MRLLLALLSLIPALSSLAADNLVNIAGPQYGTRIVADTEYSAEHAGSKAGDGSLEPGTGGWYSKDQTTLPCALTFELAAAEDLRRVILRQAAWGGNMYHTKEFAVEVSEDGKQWGRVATGELADQNLAVAEVPLEAIRTKWLRVVVLTSFNSFQTCGLAEVELLAAGVPGIGKLRLELGGKPAPVAASYCGFSLAHDGDGVQAVCLASPPGLMLALREGETAAMSLDFQNIGGPCTVSAKVRSAEGSADVQVRAPQAWTGMSLRPGATRPIVLEVPASDDTVTLRFETTCRQGEGAVWWSDLRVVADGRELPLKLQPDSEPLTLPPPSLPALRPAVERALIEWDWRLQDGIGTPRNPATFAAAIQATLQRGRALMEDLQDGGVELTVEAGKWRELEDASAALLQAGDCETPAGEALWLGAHRLRREIALKNPLAQCGPLVFAKQIPGAFSHQLTQYYGRYARPGGGVCVLERPGESMQVRPLTEGKLPVGSAQQPEVSYDGRRILFSYCQVETSPENTVQGHAGRYFHLYEIAADGSGLRQMTEGAFDDFAPRLMADDRILFISTRRRGWHRCGSPGCENYTLAVAETDGSNPRQISLHETQEWDPAILNDGRIIYTRWDYVDRNAVFYEQLWTTSPDGSRPAIFYGNNTFNPVGIWEPRPVPGSNRVMATAAAHHAMTAGSVILVDVAAGVDGPAPITRLTPEVPFPEGEVAVPPVWFSAMREPRDTPENQRWPGHCFRSPYPLSERYFLAAYSHEGLVGEPKGNSPNMFGLYLADAFGNRELLYRDLAVASAWPVPLRPRERPPVLPLPDEPANPAEATVVLQNVYAANPPLPSGSIKRLRIVQVLPKSTPGIDNPPVGIPRGAPGKQVLGTVPVAQDGSAHFRVPARTPVAFQALDETGQAVQIMRSLTYMQPGETITCVGCHEPRVTAPPVRRMSATHREPDQITPGPDGSRPFSYPLLVQPVLDKSCVRCHSGEKPDGDVALTGEPQGHYTVSYNALAPRVPVSDQSGVDSLTVPGRYGARGSGLMQMLLKGHRKVRLSPEDVERIATWMDANALFYGTFKPEDQARQQRGERISGPDLE